MQLGEDAHHRRAESVVVEVTPANIRLADGNVLYPSTAMVMRTKPRLPGARMLSEFKLIAGKVTREEPIDRKRVLC